MSARKDFVIGIDAGKTTGLCCYHRPTKKIIQLKTLDFWTAYDYVRQNFETDKCIIVVEIPMQQLYAEREGRLFGRARDKAAINVGGVAREAELLASGFERLGYEVRRVKPSDHKWDAREFKMFTKYEGQSNSHERDAAQLVWQL